MFDTSFSSTPSVVIVSNGQTENHIDEVAFDIWFEPIKTFIPKKCPEVWANTCSESEVLGGERTANASQVTRPWYKVQTDECPLCHQKGTEQHPFFHCQGWWTVCNAKGGRRTSPCNMRWMHPARRGCGKDVCVTFRGDQHTVEVVVDVIGVGCQKNPCSGAGSFGSIGQTWQ